MHVVINEGWSYFGNIEAKLGIPHLTDIALEERAMLDVATSTIEVLSVDIDTAEFAREVNMVQVNVGLVPDTSKLEHLGAVSLDRIGIGVSLSGKKCEVGHVRDLGDAHIRLI